MSKLSKVGKVATNTTGPLLEVGLIGFVLSKVLALAKTTG